MCGEGSDFRSNSFKDQGLGEVDICREIFHV